jgi:capsular exopolysaccharide synthesis family protein
MARILEKDSVNIGLLFFKIKKKWYWFALCIPLFLGTGYFYAKSLDRVYGFRSVLLLSSKRTGAARPDELLNISEGLSKSVNTDDEIGIITSYDMISKAVSELDFGISLYNGRDRQNQEIYPNKILYIRIDSNHVQMTGVPVYVRIISKDQVQIWTDEDEDKDKNITLYNFKTNEGQDFPVNSIDFNTKLKYGASFKKEYVSFQILPIGDMSSRVGKIYHFVINNPSSMVKGLKAKLNAETLKRDSYLIELTSTGSNSNKEITFLNKLMEVVIQQDLFEKNKEGLKAIAFIEAQLREAREDLLISESEKESFQSSKKLLNFDTQSTEALNTYSNLSERKIDTELKLDGYKNIYQYLIRNPNQAVVPSNFNVNDNMINGLFKQMSDLNQTKASLELNETPNSPGIIRVNRQIEETRNTLKEYLSKNIEAIQIALNSINSRLRNNTDLQTQLPYDNRNLEDIDRKYLRNADRYEILLAKKDEAQIGLETNTADIRVIEEAKKQKDAPIKPNTKFIYLLSLIAGIGLPFSIIIALDLMNGNVIDKDDIVEVTDIPLLGVVAAGAKPKKGEFSLFIQQSLTAETIRTLKLNLLGLSHLKTGTYPKKNVIGVTSTTPNEGKTFCATHLAVSLAESNKKTLLVNADLYRHDFSDYLQKTPLDLREYLEGRASMSEVINQTEIPNLEIVSRKEGMPEQVTTEMHDKIKLLISELKNSYDYIVVDIPPMGVISDYFSLQEELDTCLYVVRYNYTPKKRLNEVHELSKKPDTPKFYIVLNRVKFAEVPALSFKNKTYKYYKTNS